MTSAYARILFGAKGRESGGSPSGEEYVIFSWREIFRCICAARVFLGGKSRKKWSRSNSCLPLVFSYFLAERFCDRRKNFLWQQTIAEFKLLAYKWRAKVKRKKKKAGSKNFKFSPQWPETWLSPGSCANILGPFEARLRVVPHFSSRIVERAKRKRAWKSRVAFSCVGRFSRALAFLSLYYPWVKMGDYS